MDYKKYFAEEITKLKADIKACKASTKEYKAVIPKLEKALGKAEGLEEMESARTQLNYQKALLDKSTSAEGKARRQLEHVERLSKFEFMKIENGVIIEVSRLRQFLKKFKMHKLNYEYAQTDDGVIVSYNNVPGSVKGKLHLTPTPYEFPEHVTFPIFKESDFNA